MRRFCQHLALVALVSMSLSNAFAAVGPRAQYTLAILPLEASGRITADEANLLTERLVMELERTGTFIVTPQTTITTTLPNGGIGCSTVACGVQAGKQLAVQLVVNGTVRKVGQMYFVETQMIHANSGQVVQSASEDFDGDFNQLQNLMATVARKLVGKSSAQSREVTTASTESSPQEMTPAEYGGSNASGDTGAASGNATQYRNGGNKVLIYGLVAVGAVGAAVGITQLTKGSDNKNDKPPVSGNNLPTPPSFP